MFKIKNVNLDATASKLTEIVKFVIFDFFVIWCL